MKIRELGEFRLIDRVAQLIQREGVHISSVEGAFPLLVGIGDDAAVWRCHSATEISTTDTLVQGVHFTLETAVWRELGWKSMAVNISDVAAMGALPLYALVTLGLPGDTRTEDIDDLYHGMLEACRAYRCEIVGGDMVSSPIVFITVALNGVTDGTLLLRSAAMPGDLVAVTGPLGASAGGMRMLQQGLVIQEANAQVLRAAHQRPQPRVSEGRALVEAGVHCAMDISDGLWDDLSKLCAASGVGARLHASKVPVHPVLREVFPSQALGMALTGGEDYELVFTAPPAVMVRALATLPPGATAIGEVVPGPAGRVSVLGPDGHELPPAIGGWDHFRP
ncbi:MAG: thiamine-phosphate kinase [Chloroflexi bacterium]|nr:thiamine-phosphate kinase [Chloroflexota bacterium]